MGLIDFVRTAGEKIFGGGEAAAATKDEAVLSKRSSSLEEHVRKQGLAVDDLKIKLADDVAHVKGKVATQELREKVILAVGNVEGIARVDGDRLEVVTPAPEARWYTVVKGDNLSKIAKQHYGDANKYPAIFEANKPMLKHPDMIYPGQVLRIP
jgi:nucleoid-associated protein YgaU